MKEKISEPLPDKTIGDYYWNVIDTLFWCLPIADSTDTQQVVENEFIFHVVFRN